MPRNMAPATVSEENDLVEYYVADASSVKIPEPAGYAERYIHSEIYKRYPDVQSVVHSHSPAVIPYTISCNHALN
jgi:ribulose-5-phosphate 4-epimerase/fuculose-1-phosphate aldolase